ncbi:MAG: lactate utilization protein C [Betaproteobacteria bacterium]|nr:lactate utilization protein C [Betaproteobacteria bacterium]
MSARENILARIREKSGRNGVTSAPELAAVRAHIAEHACGPLPSISRHDPVTHFIAECARLKSTTAELDDIAALPAEVARYIAANALRMRCVGWHEFAALNWQSAGIQFDDRPANGDDLIGLTGSFCGIGETGTLLLLGAPATPKATALLPETHICVVKKSRILATMEDSFALMRNEIGEPPRATFFVSGPSRTADIEQTLVIGAHGPYRVHVILIP